MAESLDVQVNVADFHVSPDQVLRAVRVAAREEQCSEGEVSVTLVDDAEIASLNLRYLDREGSTDVIAFTLQAEGEPLLGDIYIGYEQALRQATEEGVPIDEELARLAIHGFLHVVGWDHPSGDERASSRMFLRQEALLRTVLDAAD